MIPDAPRGRRLPVVGSGGREPRTDGQGDDVHAGDSLPGREAPSPPSRFWHVLLPAFGAIVILGAGLVGQCFGG